MSAIMQQNAYNKKQRKSTTQHRLYPHLPYEKAIAHFYGRLLFCANNDLCVFSSVGDYIDKFKIINRDFFVVLYRHALPCAVYRNLKFMPCKIGKVGFSNTSLLINSSGFLNLLIFITLACS